MICNLKLFFTISKKNPKPITKTKHYLGYSVFRALYQTPSNGKDSGVFFKRVKNKNIICINNFSKK